MTFNFLEIMVFNRSRKCTLLRRSGSPTNAKGTANLNGEKGQPYKVRDIEGRPFKSHLARCSDAKEWILPRESR